LPLYSIGEGWNTSANNADFLGAQLVIGKSQTRLMDFRNLHREKFCTSKKLSQVHKARLEWQQNHTWLFLLRFALETECHVSRADFIMARSNAGETSIGAIGFDQVDGALRRKRDIQDGDAET